MKWLVVGDMHVTVDELADCEALHRLIVRTAIEEKVDGVLYLGDQHHNHALVNVHIIAFWKRCFEELKDNGFPVRALVGNHDKPGDGSMESHAMLAYPEVQVVDHPWTEENVLFVPHYEDPEQFLEAVNDPMFKDAETLVCHQEFNGAEYDNGFYSSVGVNPARVPQRYIIAGHIHKPQMVQRESGALWYPGSPRWRTLSDANTNRYIYVVDFKAQKLKEIPTSSVCKVIVALTITENDPPVKDMAVNPNIDYRIHIEGSTDFIRETHAVIAEKLPVARISTLSTDQGAIRVKESEGIFPAFEKYVEAYVPQYGAEKDRLLALARERVHV